MIAPIESLQADVNRAMVRDRFALSRRLHALRQRSRDGQPVDESLRRLEEEVRRSLSIVERRRADLPRPVYPPELPVSQKRDEIAAAIRDHQVVVVCGETGSGKTTQLPKICLELGRGVAGMIGHTQPRRIAARTVAQRIAQELETPLGHAVGYKVRFGDKLSEQTYVKLMTDGILLAETQGDRFLSRYDTIIIDEAHERSLNIDFLLGYLKQLLPQRPDLKLIITSATINPQQFSQHFGGAPIVEVSGRTYPVEVRYRPPVADDPEEEDPEPIEAILGAVDELWRDGPGDVLVFLTGEREIRETAEALRKHHPPGVEVLPLYARLGAEDQMKIFQPHGRPRIVLATNVAETSLTVPGIRYVIDPGFARMSRWSSRTKVQRLPIEHVSRASADQRKGRCGRVSEGTCVRLYSEEDFESRPQFTEPEILRTNLASVILQMKALRLGDVQDFPFLEPPDYRAIKDGLQTLHELGAIDEQNQLTPLGRDLAKLPIDPRLGRMVLAAADERCLDQVLILAAVLSIQDPRERPMEKQEQADAAHARFADERSDFLGLLKLWVFYQAQKENLSHGKLRKACKENFVSYIRMREWDDVHSQLRTIAGEVLHLRHKRHFDHSSSRDLSPQHVDAIHRSLLTGLLSNIGFRSEQHEYTAGRGGKFSIFPGSALFRRKPTWVMAAELVETTRLYARTVAQIQPQWVERVAQHLVKRTYTEPHWQAATGHVAALEKVTLFGLTLVPRRTVHYGPIDPEVSRQLFIYHALVLRDFRTRAEFFVHNARLIEEIQALEAKRRQRDLLVDDDRIYEFYDKRVPRDVYNAPLLERWRSDAEKSRPTLLFMHRRDLLKREVTDNKQEYPDELHAANGIRLPLAYVFDPSDPNDGVTATVPLAALNQLASEPFEWLVPGLLREKVVAMMKSMPKALRVKFVPVPEHADKAIALLRRDRPSLHDELAHALGKLSGEPVDRGAFASADLPPYLLMNFRIVDDHGEEVKAGRDLDQIRRDLGIQARKTFQQQPPSQWHRDGIKSWDFGDLPERVQVRRNGMTLQGYPALVDAGESVSLRLLDSADAAKREMRGGVRRLLMLQLREEVKWLSRQLPRFERMCLNYATVGSCDDLKADLVDAIIDRALFGQEAQVRTRQQFLDRAQFGWRRMSQASNELGDLVATILEKYQALHLELSKVAAPALVRSYQDMRKQLAALVYDGFVVKAPPQWLAHYPRYLSAMDVRLRKLLNAGLSRDQAGLAEVEPLQRQHDERRAQQQRAGVTDAELDQFRWMLEELRVSLFAQELKTAVPVSAKRLEAQWAKVAR
ncbi:MAG TPA: ATP-dependent RNA helicase HrpA [Tepidisphaeraceae bacterium]|nr:ATP-dependent RNA helicase HrpA [Tepidisphaeraceae bacterium]